jgi:hypothetical protein
MSYTKTVQEWAIKSDFQDLFQESDGVANVGFDINFGENVVQALVRGFDDPKMLQLFIFLSVKPKKSKFNDLLQAFNFIYDFMPSGRFTLDEENGIVFNHNAILGDVMPNTSVIEEMVGRAYFFLNAHIDGIANLAYGKLSLEDWKAQLSKE